ncbi:MAG: DUF4157 domain-containing protein [Moraxellaceae bacterium]|nr:DUF4157 domain-containing protein [Moraxellaceae bacterium]
MSERRHAPLETRRTPQRKPGAPRLQPELAEETHANARGVPRFMQATALGHGSEALAPEERENAEQEADAVAEQVVEATRAAPETTGADARPDAASLPEAETADLDSEAEAEVKTEAEPEVDALAPEAESATAATPEETLNSTSTQPATTTVTSRAATPASRHSATRKLAPPDSGQRLNSTLRTGFAQVLDDDQAGQLDDIRVHDSDAARDTAGRLGARAFTQGKDIWLGPTASSDDMGLMAHEAAHAIQQGPAMANATTGAAVPTQFEESAAGPRTPQSFGFSEDEMESRLESTPGGSRSEEVELQPGTESTLNDVSQDGGGDGEGAGDAGAGDAGGEGGDSGGGDGGTAEGGGAGGGRRPARGAAAPPAAPGGAGGGASAADAYQNLVDADVSAYLNGNVDPAGLSTLTDTTQPLLDAANGFSQQQVVEPEGSFLGNITGVSPLINAFTHGSRGYENEEPWLQTVAQIREVVVSLGGVVGMIGLVATVSGAILSLLIPPVGAFLLTVGRFCDIAALVLDIVGLALNAFLTGYNLYRLKNATDPEEKRRLLGLVRSDAMQTVMSGIAVATAVAPGAARALSQTRAGRAAGTALARVAAPIGRVAGATGRALHGAVASTRLGSAALRGVARTGAGMRALRTAASTRIRSGLVRLRGTGPIRWANRASSSLERRVAGHFDRLAAGRGRVAGFYRRRVRGFHERNRRVAEMIGDPIERAHYLERGTAMRNRLATLQADPNIANVRGTLEREFGIEHATPVTLPGGAAARTPNGSPIHRGDFAIDGGPGNYRFDRVDSDVLYDMRRREFAEIQNIRATYPNATDAELARLVNDSPFIRGRWTDDEMRALRQIHTGTDVNVGGVPGTVPKTAHHTIPAQMAPEIHRDPRFMQMVNDTRFYDDALGSGATAADNNFLRLAYPDSGPNPYSRMPSGRANIGAVRVPGARPGTTRAARNLTEVTEQWVRGGNVAGVSDVGFFESDAFRRELRDQGSTGAWVNPRDPSGAERRLFNPHLELGHEGNWAREIDRSIFDMNARLGLPGEVGRRLGSAAPREAARTLPRYLAGMGGDGGAAGPTLDAGAGAGPAAAGGNAVDRFVDSIYQRMGRSAVTATAAAPSAAASPTAPAASTAPSAPAAPTTTAETAAPAAADAMAAVPEAPPSPVAYSPESLAGIAEQRASVAAAIEAVQAYLQAAVQSQADNEAARETAEGLHDSHESRSGNVESQQADVSDQQGKLEQASGAQAEMVAEGENASSEGQRGQSEGERTNAEGEATSVEPKAEEPESKGWLERAWDATAGALWEELIRPAVNLVRRKVNQVMQAIGEFITNMINQVLGLDEIEAELNGGGEDIAARDESLAETGTGLTEEGERAATGMEDTAATMERADANVAEAATAQEEAQTLLQALTDHDQALAGEEAAGKAYIQEFGSQHADYFAYAAESSEGATEGGDSTAGSEASAAPAEAAPEESDAEAGDGVERLQDAQLAPLRGMISAVRRAESDSASELAGVAAQSGALAPETAATATAASAGFRASQGGRRGRLDRLAAEASSLVGLPSDQAHARLEDLSNQVAAIADELETARQEALQNIAAAHDGAADAGAEDETSSMENV